MVGHPLGGVGEALIAVVVRPRGVFGIGAVHCGDGGGGLGASAATRHALTMSLPQPSSLALRLYPGGVLAGHTHAPPDCNARRRARLIDIQSESARAVWVRNGYFFAGAGFTKHALYSADDSVIVTGSAEPLCMCNTITVNLISHVKVLGGPWQLKAL